MLLVSVLMQSTCFLKSRYSDYHVRLLNIVQVLRGHKFQWKKRIPEGCRLPTEIFPFLLDEAL